MIKLQIIAFYTILRKEVFRIVRIWPQTLLPSAVTMTLYFTVFGGFISDKIGIIHGFTYIQFIVPGLIMMSVITNSFANVASSFFSTKFQRSIEELLVSPIRMEVIILGFVGGGLFRGVAIGFIVTMVSFIFVSVKVHSVLIIISVVFLASVLFSLAGFLNGILAKKFDDINIFPTFILTPLTYLGGVFYSVSFFSPTWKVISSLNPILYMINAFRYGFLGYSDISIVVAFVIMISFIIVLASLCYYLLVKGYRIKN